MRSCLVCNLKKLFSFGVIALATLITAESAFAQSGYIDGQMRPLLDCGGGPNTCNPSGHWKSKDWGKDPTLIASGLRAGEQIRFFNVSGSVSWGKGTHACTGFGVDAGVPKLVPILQFANDNNWVVNAGIPTIAGRNAIRLGDVNGVTLTVPAGATRVFGSWPDSRYYDNRGGCSFNYTVVRIQCKDGIDNDGDGLVDMSDPGCSSPEDNNEGDGTTQCQDGKDNDGDGAVDFPADFSCTNKQDNDEATPKAQCQDGVDNDGDGLSDLQDPGCSSAQDNNEGDGTTQCQDSKDNDADGATDYPADFSCSDKFDNDETNPKAQCQDGIDNDGDGAIDYPADFSCSSKQDNDEANPKAQCQDSLDNDGDGLVDLEDPGCSSKQDNNESDGTTQCQDGKDNDADGAVDYPADFSCSSKLDNDETTPKAQCQDGADNDNDGLSDLEDPGCSSKQDNNESDGTTQCQDGKDNDNDGAVDFPADFSCSSKKDNDEETPKAQCQDGVDNDKDGLNDLEDPGCSSNQDNNESDGTTQCQDGKDNDADGAVDGNDPGCDSPKDNDEQDSAHGIMPIAECVFDNHDGTYTAWFGYENLNSAPLTIAVGNAAASGINAFSPDPLNRSQTSTFNSGRVKGAFSVIFDGSTIEWTIKPAGAAKNSIKASKTTKACAPIKPIMECVDVVRDGSYTATYGYQNDNPFEISVPIGGQNKFDPNPEDRGQPNKFFPGLINGVFTVNFPSETITWNLRDQSAQATRDSDLCLNSQGCRDTPLTNTKSELDATALALADVARQAAERLDRIANKQTKRGSVRVTSDGVRSLERAQLLLDEAQRLAFQFPEVVKNCPNAPEFCAKVDNQPTIDGLARVYNTLVHHIRRTVARGTFRRTGDTEPITLVKKANDAFKKGKAALATIPRFATDCK